MTTDIIIHDKKDNVGVVVIEKITPKQVHYEHSEDEILEFICKKFS